MTVEDVARICHEANKAYCQSLGDHSQLPWANAPEWQRRSALNGVEFHLRTANLPPSASHDNWLKEKAEAGWTYGLVKNEALKQHPCFVPYDQLPDEAKSKDFIFTAIVNACASLVTHGD